MIIAKNLSKSYGKTTYLKEISIHVKRGSVLAVAGENGAGKTTLLKILATVSKPDSGQLSIGGCDAILNPAQARENLGYVPQGNALMQELSVRDNLVYWMKHKDEQLYQKTLEAIGLKEVEKKRVSKLSGGMKRRLNIGASLVLHPSVLILDEPLAGVDSANRRRIISLLGALKRDGVAMVITSHYIEDMRELADELVALKNGQVTYYGKMDFSSESIGFSSLSEGIKYFTES